MCRSIESAIVKMERENDEDSGNKSTYENDYNGNNNTTINLPRTPHYKAITQRGIQCIFAEW